MGGVVNVQPTASFGATACRKNVLTFHRSVCCSMVRGASEIAGSTCRVSRLACTCRKSSRRLQQHIDSVLAVISAVRWACCHTHTAGGGVLFSRPTLFYILLLPCNPRKVKNVLRSIGKGKRRCMGRLCSIGFHCNTTVLQYTHNARISLLLAGHLAGLRPHRHR